MFQWPRPPLSFGRCRSVHHLAATLAKNQKPCAQREKTRYHQVAPGDLFKDGRYIAITGLGQGRYSHVWLAKDLKAERYVALKILTADCYGKGHDIFELDLLRDVAKHQSLGSSRIISILDNFQHKSLDNNHECIVAPVPGSDLSVQALRFSDKRIPVHSMKKIARQILEGLQFLHSHCGIIHTDLKPSNILFQLDKPQETIEATLRDETASSRDITRIKTPLVTEVKDMQLTIIDLGVSCWVHKRLSDSIQPVHLRAPEVILGAPWGTPVDIWSLGCVVIEPVKGVVVFPGSARPKGKWTSEDDHLAQYMEVLGPMPRELLLRGSRTKESFDNDGNLLRIPKLQWTSLDAHMDGERYPFRRPDDMSKEDALLSIDFLRGALSLDPDQRKTAGELLQHPWLYISS